MANARARMVTAVGEGQVRADRRSRVVHAAGKSYPDLVRQRAGMCEGAPDAVVIYQLLGLVYEREKKYADAIALYEEFLKFFPSLPESDSVRSFIIQLRKEMDAPQT